MTPQASDRVFGTSRLKMVTGQYVEVYREAAAAGERRRYTKRFLSTQQGDFRQWTEREWRILARLVGHGARHVPDVVQYDRGTAGGHALVQTYDAGVTLDHWVTLLPVQRGGRVQRHVFQDCAHWWALARHLLLALHEIHSLRLAHLDFKADNICLPLAPPGLNPTAGLQHFRPVFEDIAVIDFAFSLISGEALTSPLPIGWQRAFPYQSPRLLRALVAGHDGDLEPTRQLDWRCDMYSLAALLNSYLPGPEEVRAAAAQRGWTDDRHVEAKVLLLKVRDSHDRDPGSQLPHLGLAAACAAQLQAADLIESLSLGWTLAADTADVDAMAPTAPLTLATVIEPQAATGAVVTEVIVRRWPDGVAAITPPAETAMAVSTAPAAGQAVAVVADTTRAAEPPALQPAPPPAGQQDAVVVDAMRPRPRRALAVGLLLGLIAASTAVLVALRNPQDGDAPPTTAAQRPVAAGEHAGVVAKVESATAEPVTPGATPPADTASAVATAPTQAPPAVAAPPATAAPPPRRVATATPPPAPAVDRGDAAAAAAAPAPTPRPTAATAPGEDRYARRASEVVAQWMPIVVQRASPRVDRVLAAAAQAADSSDDRRTVDAAANIGNRAFSESDRRLGALHHAAQGRHLNAAARAAFWQRGDVDRAFDLQWQAFGANPTDPEIAGNLAFYALKTRPRQVELSRALAIYALAAATRAPGPTRLEDWGNLAVASALSGRPRDATNAMLVLVAVSRDVNRSCRSALSSVASFGPALQAPARALMSRAQARAGSANAPHCQSPQRWPAGQN